MSLAFHPGQHVKVRRGSIYHYGIYMGFHSGMHLVAEQAKPADGGKKRLTEWKEFAVGRVEVVEHPNGLPPAQVIANVQRWPQNAPYDLIMRNCEHFATSCATGLHESTQVNGVIVLLLAGILLWRFGT